MGIKCLDEPLRLLRVNVVDLTAIGTNHGIKKEWYKL